MLFFITWSMNKLTKYILSFYKPYSLIIVWVTKLEEEITILIEFLNTMITSICNPNIILRIYIYTIGYSKSDRFYN